MYYGGTHSNPPPIPRLHLPAVFLSLPPALSQFFRLFYLLSASGTTVFWEITFAPHTAQPMRGTCLCKRMCLRPPSSARLSSSFDKLTCWRGLFTHLRADYVPPPCVQAQTSPQVCQISVAGAGPLPRVDFPFWPSRFTWLAVGLSFLMQFKMGAHLNIARYDASLARNMATTCTLTLQHYFGLQIWLPACVNTARGGWLVCGSVFTVTTTGSLAQ